MLNLGSAIVIVSLPNSRASVFFYTKPLKMSSDTTTRTFVI
jgi:hypothetical protein